ncbi:MAG: dihydroneopterin aldolase [Elusimicrobia bacterium]|nr:dihydroneopterin aldolase [Elusimicrobiota bacterium]
MDRIRLKGIRCRAVVGVEPSERVKAQAVEIDLALEAPCAKAGRSDRLADAVDYQRVEEAVREAAGSGRRDLLERLAEEVAEAVLGCDGRIAAVTVRVGKKPASMPRSREVVVEIRRSRSRGRRRRAR